MPNIYVSTGKFKENAKSGSAQDGIALRKQFISEVKAGDDGKREITFVISTDSVDRDGDKISVDGWDLKNYRKNPTVLWAHDYRQPPIARATEILVADGKLKATAEFMGEDLSPFADRIYRMLKAGFLNATSVGFMPRKWMYAEEEARKYGIDFAEQELLEFSVVPVPANAEALVEARSMGIDTEPLEEWAKSILGNRGDLSLTIDTTEAQRAVKELADSASQVISDLDMRLRKAHIARLKSL